MISENRPRAFAQRCPCAGTTTATWASRRETACAKSTRRTIVRGWNVWFSNGSRTPARVTDEDPRLGPMTANVGDDADIARPHPLDQRRQVHTDQRREIAAGDLRRRRDGLVLGGQPRGLGARTNRVALGLDRGVGLDGQRVRVGLHRGIVVAARRQDVAQQAERRCVGRVERNGLAQILERRILVAPLALDDREFAIQERRVRRPADGRAIRSNRFVAPAGARGLPGRRHVLLHDAEFQDVDPPLQIDQRAIGGKRRLEGVDRLCVPSERQQRLAPAGQRRGVVGLARECPIEMDERRTRLLAGELDVAAGGFRRIEVRSSFQRLGNLAVGVPKIARLQEEPGALLVGDGAGCPRGRPARSA